MKVTWDTEALWARLRMRVPSTNGSSVPGRVVEMFERYDSTKHASRDRRAVLWALARRLYTLSMRVKKGEPWAVVFERHGTGARP